VQVSKKKGTRQKKKGENPTGGGGDKEGGPALSPLASSPAARISKDMGGIEKNQDYLHVRVVVSLSLFFSSSITRHAQHHGAKNRNTQRDTQRVCVVCQ
jgi:hypothetical protein